MTNTNAANDNTIRQRSKPGFAPVIDTNTNIVISPTGKSKRNPSLLTKKFKLHPKSIPITITIVTLFVVIVSLSNIVIQSTTSSLRSLKDDTSNNIQHLQENEKPSLKTCIITISAMNNFGFVWNLYDSVLENNPGIDCFAWFVGDAPEPQEQHGEAVGKGLEEIKEAVGKLPKFKMVTMNEMEASLTEFEALKMAFMFDLVELQTTLKPFAFQYTFKEFNADAAIYLDNDIWVTSSLGEIENELIARSAVVTPHCATPIPRDGRKQTDKNVLSSGVFNFGFVAFRKTDATEKFLAWWAERLTLYGFVDPPKSMFYDQNWGMFIPAFFDHEDYMVLRDLRYNIAYWNLHERGAGLNMKDGIPHLINDETGENEKVVFMHFSGISVLERYDMEGISRHQNRFTLHDFSQISDVFDAYMEKISAHYTLHFRNVPYGYSQFSDGTIIEPWMRKVYAAAVLPIGTTKYLIFDDQPPYDDVISVYNRFNFQKDVLPNPFCSTETCYTDTSKRRFIDWIMNFTPNQAVDMQGDFFFNYLQDKVWHDRPDLQGAYQHPRGGDFDRYQDWFRTSARESVSEALMEKFAEAAADHEDDSYKFHKVVNSITDTNIGLNIIGWHAGKSIESLDGTRIVRAAFEAGIPVNAIELEMLRGEKYSLPSELDFPLSRSISEPINLVIVNPHLVHELDKNIPDIIMTQKFNIAYWSSHLDELPEKWSSVLSGFEAVFCASDFIKERIENSSGYNGTTVEVLRVPLATRVKEIDFQNSTSLVDILSHRKKGEKPFVFFTEFDFDSMERKNPEAAISAFIDAFPATDDVQQKYQLIVKSNYAPTVEIRKLKAITNHDPRVVFVNEFLSDAESEALLNYQDCFISLHRSESVGNNVLEAMRRKVPVIATNYGAHLEYITQFPAFAEDSCLFSISHKRDLSRYWVEPNKDSAILAMRKVVANNCKQSLSDTASSWTDDIESKYSRAAVGKELTAMIKNVLPSVIDMYRKNEYKQNVLRFVGNYNHSIPESKVVYQRNITQISIVISHCDKSVDWISDFITDNYHVKDITVYKKCENDVEGLEELESLTGQISTVKLPNVGRCDHSYAYWIKTHYESIVENKDGSDIVLFMKDNNYNAKMYRSFDEIFTATSSVGFGCALKPIWCDCPEGWHQCEKNDGLMLHNQTVLNTFSMNHRHIRIDRDNGETDTFTNKDYPNITSWKNAMGLVTPDTETIPVCYGGVFAVQKRQLLKQSLEAWTNVEKSLTREDNLVEGHYAERMWGPILSNIGEEFGEMVDKYVGPHANQTSSCIGRVGMMLIPRNRQIFRGMKTIERSPGMTVPK